MMVGIGVSVRSRGVVGRQGSARGAGASLGKSAERVTSHREDAGARAAETGETAGPDRGGRRTLETARVPREVDAPRNTSETNSSRAPTPRARLIWPAEGEHPTMGPRLRNTVATTTSDSGRKSGPAPAGAHRFFAYCFPYVFPGYIPDDQSLSGISPQIRRCATVSGHVSACHAPAVHSPRAREAPRRSNRADLPSVRLRHSARRPVAHPRVHRCETGRRSRARPSPCRRSR